MFSVIKKYLAEFILIFISVLLGFAFTEWSSSRGEAISQSKILTEIKNGIHSDYKDFSSNVASYKVQEEGVNFFRNWVDGQVTSTDSFRLYYLILFRNFTPIINSSAYESLKASNIKTIEDDSLRLKIIALYEYHYRIIEKLEDSYGEMQDFSNYFKPVNDMLYPYLIFDNNKNVIGIAPHNNSLSTIKQKELLSYMWRMQMNRKFKVIRYNETLEKIKDLELSIDKFLK